MRRVLRLDDVEVKYVAVARPRVRQIEMCPALQPCRVPGGPLNALVVPRVDVLQLGAEDAGMEVVQAAVEAEAVDVSLVRPVVPQLPDLRVDIGVIGESKVLDACDARDGVKDGVLDDPRECPFKIGDLPACPDDRAGADCVTSTERAAIQRIYSPTISQGATIYPGQPFGGEGQPGGWQPWITGMNASPETQGRPPSLQFAFGTEFFKYLALGRKDFDYATYDLSNWDKDTAAIAKDLNALDSDLAKFKARQSKLILAHGWADPALNPLSTIAYYEKVQTGDPRLRDYVRLFMMPGVLHCAGGPGPDFVDWFSPIAEWVEHGHAPDRVIAQKRSADGRVLNARPLCPYPQRAVYDGKGSITEAESFVCRTR